MNFFALQPAIFLRDRQQGDVSAGNKVEDSRGRPRPPRQRRKWGGLLKTALEGVPETACAEVRFFCDYWLGLKGDALLPSCEQLDPLDFFSYLSRVFIAEGRTVKDLRIRLAGTIYRELYGFEITAKHIAELIPFDKRQDLMCSYARCLDQKTPVYEVNKMTWRERGSEVSYERILLPFGSAEGGVERILGFAQFYDSDGRKLFT